MPAGKRTGFPGKGLDSMATDLTVSGQETPTQLESRKRDALRFTKSAQRFFGVLGLVMVAFSVAPVGNSALRWKNKDYDLWYETGRRVAAGEVLYPTDGRPFPFMYPPSCASMLAILSYLDEPAFVIVLDAINSAAWIGAVLLSIYLVVGRVKGVHWLLYVVPSAVVAPFVHDTFLLGQPNLLLLTAMLGAFACLRRGRGGLAGVLVAFGAAVKAFPILALGYLVWRRAWKAVGATVLALALMLMVLPLPFRGPEQAWTDLKVWTEGMVLKYNSKTIAQRPVRSFSFKNQSVQALANRLMRDVPADGEEGDTWQVNLVSLDFRAVNIVVLAMAGFLGLTYVLVMPYGSNRNRSTDSAETAMLLCLILAFSPLSFDYFFVWLLYPLSVAVAMALDAPKGSARKRALWGWIGLTVGLLALSIPWRREAQAFGNLLGASLVLFFGLAVSMKGLVRKTEGILPEPIEEDTAYEPPAPALSRRRRRRRVALGVVAGLGLVAAVVAPVVEEHWYDYFEKKVAVVEPGRLVRGGWQRPEPLRRILKREHIKTIVTLAPPYKAGWRYQDQAKVVAETGVRWIFVPMVESTATLAQMAEAADLLADPSLQPVYFHCVAGHHRTSLAHAAYRIRHDGWSAGQAWKELEEYPWTRPGADTEDQKLIWQFAKHRSVAPSHERVVYQPDSAGQARKVRR